MKERELFIDIAKGLLILLVILGHLPQLSYYSPYKNELLEWTNALGKYYSSFYMPAFFLITGYCSNFDKTTLVFVKRQVKGLLIPSIFFSIVVGLIEITFIPNTWLSYSLFSDYILKFGGLYWFLTALFIAKIIFFFINKTPQKTKPLIICVLFTIACVTRITYSTSPPCNYFYWIHSFILLPFIYLGSLLRTMSEKAITRIVVISSIFYIAACVIFIVIREISMPFINGGFIMISYKSMLLYPLIAFSGSMIVIAISKLIAHNRLLELIGQQTLPIYCVHFLLLEIFYSVFGASFANASIAKSIMATVLMLMSCSCLYLILYRILNTRYLRFIIGK